MVHNKLFSKLRMFWSKLCKSSWNCEWNLAFPVFISPIVWNMCENLHYESAYFKELHNEQEYYCERFEPRSHFKRLSLQGHPATALCKTSVRRSKNCLRFSIAWGRLKISRWPFHLICTIFLAYLINSLRFFKV